MLELIYSSFYAKGAVLALAAGLAHVMNSYWDGKGLKKPLRQSAVWIVCFFTAFFCVSMLDARSFHADNGDRFYYGKDGFTPNLDKAISTYAEAAATGDGYSCRMLGVIHMEKGQDYESVSWLNKGISLGDARSGKILGDMYATELAGKMTARDRNESMFSAYYMAECLGEPSLSGKVASLANLVPASTKRDASDRCAKIKKTTGR